jgi:HTH-type transcriptional regulator / antitoxin HigA
LILLKYDRNGDQKINSKEQYLATLARFEEIFQSKPGTDENDEADVLALIIIEYKERHFDIEAPVL